MMKVLKILNEKDGHKQHCDLEVAGECSSAQGV